MTLCVDANKIHTSSGVAFLGDKSTALPYRNRSAQSRPKGDEMNNLEVVNNVKKLRGLKTSADEACRLVYSLKNGDALLDHEKVIRFRDACMQIRQCIDICDRLTGTIKNSGQAHHFAKDIENWAQDKESYLHALEVGYDIEDWINPPTEAAP